MYLDTFNAALRRSYSGSLFSVKHAYRIHSRAKEYLYRLKILGEIRCVGWGWYYVPKKQDVWSFLANDKNFKVLIKQTAASIWNYDFVHRNVYRLAVKDRGFKRALEALGKEQGWMFEVEVYSKIPYEYKKVGKLLVESLESSIVSCIAEWSFLDALAMLYFRRDKIDFKKLRGISRWRRLSRSNTRVWSVIKYACSLFNEKLGEKLFNVRKTSLSSEIKELVDEAVDRVLEFA
ncbi:MAG: hypothetical protein F7B11_01675 [Caldisphaeraceae archaeon]|nr:hypothetical protein [Caldisphaeraceae archaeon]